MAENANLLSTPEGYATPDQIKSTYEYAKALMSGNLQQPVHHWTQGVSNMVSALVGGNLDYKAAQQQNEANAVRAGRMLPSVSGSATSFSEGPSSAGSKNAGGDAGSAIAGIESGGDYASLGPTTKTGDRAYGKYQVMGANIPEWTQATLGKSMTPEEFLKNPQAQDAVFKTKFGEYTNKYGPEGAAKAWFAGEKGMNNPNAKDQLGTTVDSYGKKFMSAYAPDGAPANPAVTAISSALRGEPAGTQVAAGKAPAPTTSPMVMPNGQGQPLIDPALVQRRPQYNEGQMRGILSDPTISEQAKLGLLQAYQQQDQPISMAYPGGTVLIDPRDPRRQQFIPEGHWGKTKLGDMEKDNFLVPNANGSISQPPPPPVAPGPRSDATPPAATPSAAPQGGPTPTAASVQAAAQNVPAAPASPSEAPMAAPVQVASLDPTAGIAPAPEKPGSTPKGAGYEHFNPESGKIEKVSDDAKVAEAATPNNPLAKWAQASLPGGLSLNNFSAQDTDDYARKKAFDIKNAVDEEAQKKGVDFATKKYDTLSTQAQSARKQMPNLDYALALMNDPNFYSGLGANEVTAWKQLKAAFPSVFGEGSALAAAPNEVFNKVISGSILDNMRTALGGLGQVRLAEIDLLKKANASTQNTPAANRALLELSKRAVTSLDHIDEMGQAYYSGDDVVDPVSGKMVLKANLDRNGEIQPRRGLDVGFDKIARKYALDHPSLSPEDIKNYETIFKTGIDPRGEPTAPTKTGETAPPAVGSTKMFDDGKGGKVEGVWDGKAYAPKVK